MHTLFIESLFTKMWDIQRSPQRTRWDLLLVSVDLISPPRAYTISIQRERKASGIQRRENYWEQAAWRSNSSDQSDLAAKIWGEATSMSFPFSSPTGAFHWPKLPSSLGAGSMLMSPKPVQQPRQRPGSKGKTGGLEAQRDPAQALSGTKTIWQF